MLDLSSPFFYLLLFAQTGVLYGDQLQPVRASQSTTYADKDTEFGAANCIDGETGADVGPDGRRRLCHTKPELYPWLAIDFGKTVSVQRVEIFNRLGCCGDRTQNVRVRISDELPTSRWRPFEGGAELGRFAGPGTDGQHIIIPDNPGQEISGRYVVVQISKRRTRLALNLKEVKVFGRSESTGAACKCGMEYSKKIVGGDNSESGKYPWMVALWDRTDTSMTQWESVHCGGTLIASGWVVTAAHCMWYEKNGVRYKHTKDTLYVVLGEFDLSSSNDQFDTNRKEVQLQLDPITHKNYNYPKHLSNDIALLKLAEDVNLSTYTPACLPPSGADYTGQNGRVYGWGSLRSCPLQYPDILREVEVGIISDAACEAQSSNSVIYKDKVTGQCRTGSANYRDQISDEMLCAGAPGKDSCQGDSGGPFTVKESTTEQHELVGVVSWGYGCAANGLSGVYAEVAKLRGWIDDKIAANGGATFCA